VDRRHACEMEAVDSKETVGWDFILPQLPLVLHRCDRTWAKRATKGQKTDNGPSMREVAFPEIESQKAFGSLASFVVRVDDLHTVGSELRADGTLGRRL
jgi:hypothetical protein